MQLEKIREEYEQNYQQMIETIEKMGGNARIKIHRKMQTPLYRKLKKLQKLEHYLDDLETGVRKH